MLNTHMLPIAAKDDYRQAAYYLILISVPMLLSLFLYGSLLNPTNVGWLLFENDPQQHFIGWHFFRREAWGMPLGAFKSLAYPVGSSVVYTDSIPLIAIFLKLFHTILPEYFQYLGIASSANFILNTIFAFYFFRKSGLDIANSTLGSFIVLLQPIVFMRGLVAHGHTSLTSHWLLIFAIHISIFPDKSSMIENIKWISVLLLSLAIHFYIFLMVFVLWTGYAAIKTYKVKNDLNKLYKHILTMIFIACAIISTSYILGYFTSNGGINADGFGVFSAELLTFFNPRSKAWFLQNDEYSSLSLFFKGWSTPIWGQYEGQAYMGAGAILIVLAGFCIKLWSGLKVTNIYAVNTILVSSTLFIISLSNTITFLDNSYTLELNNRLYILLGTIRSSGRLSWALLYVILMLSIIKIYKKFGKKSIAILIFCITLQIFDLWPSLMFLHNRSEDISKKPLQSTILGEFENLKIANLMKDKKNLTILPLPTDQKINETQHYAWIAAQYGLNINSTYLARANRSIMNEYAQHQLSGVLNGTIPADTLYVITDDAISKVACANGNSKCAQISEHTLLWSEEKTSNPFPRHSPHISRPAITESTAHSY